MLPKRQTGTSALTARGALIVAVLAFLPAGLADARGKAAAPAAPAAALWNVSPVGTIDSTVFDLALRAATCAVRTGAVTDPPTLTVIDYSKPSTEKRLWVFDLRSRELVYE